MSKSFALACFLLSTAASTFAQCAYYEGGLAQPTTGISTINFIPLGDEPFGATSLGVGRWAFGCSGSGSNYPSLSTSPYSTAPGTMNVYINYQPGRSTEQSGRCGKTDVTVDPNTGQINGAFVTIWEFDVSGNSCYGNLAGLVGHEIGHVLGLADVDWNSSCNGTIMGFNPDYVSTDQCQFVDMEWTTPGEDPPGGLPNPGPQCTNDEVSPCSPIVINFENGDYRLTGANAPVSFDMAGTGHPVQMGWTAPGANEAFLWLDREHNGKVDSGAELFGNFTVLKNGQRATNGFEALAEFDDNHDGVIDEHDAIWSRLMLWRDLNHSGTSEPSELSPLAGSGVVAIDLAYHFTGRTDLYGNQFRYESKVWFGDDNRPRSRAKPIYDIFFVRAP